MKPSTIDTGLAFAEQRDDGDQLAEFRQEFDLPRRKDGRPGHYLCGHSLGLMPRRAKELVNRELDRWATLGVAGHFDSAEGWFGFHERFSGPLATMLGADPREVVAMNSLTVNLHLMLASFFLPDGDRKRILIERDAFPSDRYAVKSQLAFHGLVPSENLIELIPESGQLSADALDAALASHAGRVALVLLPGVQYLSGEAIDMPACASVARRHGCRIGFDLAHAIGNLEIDLRAADPDFAVWCSYKYLNAGPGAIGGCFVNQRCIGDRQLPRLEGWWGHDKQGRFERGSDFRPIDSAEAWQLSNPPILAMSPLQASLELFGSAGMKALRQKSILLTDYLESLLVQLCADRLELLTPGDSARRGAQLSLKLGQSRDQSARIVHALGDAGISVDWRSPDILRLAPAPLYNTFVDVHTAATALATALRS